MLDDVKKAALNHAMKIMQHPQVSKIMSNPKVMDALSKGFEIHGQIRHRVENTIRFLAVLLGRPPRD